LTAFSIYFAKGVEWPVGVTPGMAITVSPKELLEAGIASGDAASVLGAIDLSRLEPGDIVPFIEEANFLIEQIGTVSRTPLPGFMGGDNASGEALKQREAGLVSKVKKTFVRFGNAWEDVVKLAHTVESTFSTRQPPKVLRFRCEWGDAEIRNDSQYIADVLLIADRVGDKKTLELLGNVYNWQDTEIKQIMDDKASQTARVNNATDRLAMDDYSNLFVPTQQPDVGLDAITAAAG